MTKIKEGSYWVLLIDFKARAASTM